MKNCLRIFEILLICLMFPTLFGCAESDTEFDGGEKLTPERMEQIRESLRVGQTDETEFIPDTYANGNIVYYWVKNGSVIHANADCYHIAESKDVISGSAEDAKEYGIERKCSACAGGD